MKTGNMVDQLGACFHENKSHSFKPRPKPVKETSGTPMKSLIAEEMLRDTGRSKSPGVIARLMGLESISSQDQAVPAKKKLLKTDNRKTSGEHQVHNYLLREHVLQRNIPQQFKDIHEVRQTSKADKRMPLPDKKDVNSKFSMEREAYVRQKFIDAKRLSCDERCHSSKDFHDALEVLESNKDIFLKILQEPNSLFEKHLLALQNSSLPPPESVLNSAKSSLPEKSAAHYDRDRKCKDEALTETPDIRPPNKFLKSFYEESGTTNLPTRIVVLKPNLRAAQTMGEVVPLPNSFPNSFITRRRKEDIQQSDRSDRLYHQNGRSMTAKSREQATHRQKSSRDIAREITLEMRRSADSNFMSRNFTLDRDGFMNEKPSTSTSSEILSDHKISKFSSSRYSALDAACDPSSLRSKESYVSREAKRRLSERWKMTHKSQKATVHGGSSTLGEMLSYDGTSSMRSSSSSMVFLAGSRDKSPGRLPTPIGMSSKDGLKRERPAKLTKSRSLPASASADICLNTERRCDALSDEEGSALRKVVHLSLENQEENLLLMRETATLRSMNLGSTSGGGNIVKDVECEIPTKKSKSTPNVYRDAREATNIPLYDQQVLPVIHSHDTESQLEGSSVCSDHERKFLSEESQRPHPTTLEENIEDTITLAVNATLSEDCDRSLWESNSEAGVSEIQAYSKESEQPSPTSVLESLSDEDLSNTDCFEKVSAGLHELRLQLKLLKMDSFSPAVSDVEGEQECNSPSEANEPNELEEEERDFSFILDALVISGLDASFTLLATRFSAEFPINPALFEELDQKYERWKSWSRGERQLLFDQMNSALSELLDSCIDDRPYVKSKAYRIVPLSWSTEDLAEMIWKLLCSEGNDEKLNWAGKNLKWNLVWTDFSGDIDKIGQELQGFLLQDLMEEVVLELASGMSLLQNDILCY